MKLDEMLEILEKFYVGEIDSNRKALTDILEVHSDLINTVYDAKIQFPTWKLYFETLIHKLIINSYSILELSKGYNINAFNKKVKGGVIDCPSLYILTRSLIENYLTLKYIYLNDLPEDEKLFRFKLWEVSGLITRQQFKPGSENEFFDKLVSEKEAIKKINQELLAMPEFQSLDKRKLNSLDNYGLPRLESWHSLIDQSGLDKEMYSTLYSLFSSYSHSEYLSIMQIKQTALNGLIKENEHQVRLCLNICAALNSLVIEWLVSNFKSVEIVYNTIPRASQLAIQQAIKFSKAKK